MPQDIIIADQPESFSEIATEWIIEKIDEAIDARGVCRLALSGGQTPRPVYKVLASPRFVKKIDWSRMEFYFGDERCVSPTDPDSNYRMAHEWLFSIAPVTPKQIMRIEAEHADRDQAAAEYEARLPQRLDLLLLGIGTDGHTASLFPGSPALDEKKRKVVPVCGPKPPLWRITITPPVIANARTRLVLVSGSDKALMVVRALHEPCDPRKLPIQLALDATWLLDSSAAEGLVRPGK